MQKKLSVADAEVLHQTIQIGVLCGFATRAEMVSAAVNQVLSPSYNYDMLYKNACACADELLEGHYARQRYWKTTDCDRIDEAFAELEREGIIARRNYSDSQARGHEDIAALFEAPEYRKHLGYVFYHPFDTQQAVTDGYMYIAFGSKSGNEADVLAVGALLVKALERQGLSVVWSYSVQTRPKIEKLSWQYRRIKELDYETEL